MVSEQQIDKVTDALLSHELQNLSYYPGSALRRTRDYWRQIAIVALYAAAVSEKE